jgi:hypothetical protein
MCCRVQTTDGWSVTLTCPIRRGDPHGAFIVGRQLLSGVEQLDAVDGVERTLLENLTYSMGVAPSIL